MTEIMPAPKRLPDNQVEVDFPLEITPVEATPAELHLNALKDSCLSRGQITATDLASLLDAFNRIDPARTEENLNIFAAQVFAKPEDLQP